MGLSGIFGQSKQKKEYLLEMQKLVLQDSPDKLIMSESELKSNLAMMVKRNLEISQDCIKIVGNTKDADTFFMRLSLLGEKSRELVDYGRFVKMNVDPMKVYEEYCNDRQECIRLFLQRCYTDACEKAISAKTARGKIGKYRKYIDSFAPYYDFMDDYNKGYIETRFVASIEEFSK